MADTSLPPADPPSPGHDSAARLTALLGRMRSQSDFPAMSDAVVRIQGMASSDTESVASFTNEILKDVALTQKLLRLVNSAHFGARSGGIHTVSRAVSLVGFNGVRTMALSLVLLENMRNKAHASQIKDEFLRALMAGSIATELCVQTHENEEAFIAAMFQNLGRMLAELYFPDEARQVRHLVLSGVPPQPEASASASVLGVGYDALGLAVAKTWGLPDTLQRSMRRPPGEPPLRPPVESIERMRWTALVANDIADLLLHTAPPELPARLAQLEWQYAKTLGLSAPQIHAATLRARKKLIDMSVAMELQVAPGSPAAQLLQPADAGPMPDPEHASPPEPAPEPPDALAPLALQAAAQPADTAAVRRLAILAAGIQDTTQALLDDIPVGDVLRMVLETMYRALAFQRIVFCLRDPKSDTLLGRFGLGAGVDAGSIDSVVKSFQIRLQASSLDLFSTVCLKGVDTLIHDASEPRIAQRLPAWYASQLHVPTFLLMPLALKGKPFGLVYADHASPGLLDLDEPALALLRALRNQATLAFKHAV